MHVALEPAILYLGTPVVLVSTTNPDGSANLAPFSSAFWLGWRCVLGLSMGSRTSENLLRTRQCVVNLPSEDQAPAVDRVARTTGRDPVQPYKQARGYVAEGRKFERAGLRPVASQTVAPPRALECPIQLEAVLEASHGLAEDDERLRGGVRLFELRVTRVHADESVLLTGHANRIDPDRWRPLIMSFQRFYGLSAAQVHGSRLAEIDESFYRSPDVDRSRMDRERRAA